MEEMIGKVIDDKYRILELIGQGGTGNIYKALHVFIERVVVVKVINSDFFHDPASEQRFRREARVMASLAHPNIVTVYDFGVADGLIYLVMEYVEGRSLEQISAGKPLELDYAVEIIRQVGDGLSYAHNMGVIHRDIKPSNILISSNGQVKLLDYGLALVPGQSSLTQTGLVMGTPAYMSPEQAKGERLDQRSDIYSLALVLYELLTGRLPFSGATPVETIIATVTQAPPSLQQFNSAVSPAVEQVVLKSLAKDPAARYQTVDEFVKDLLNAQPWAYRLGSPAANSAPTVYATPPPVDGAILTAPPTAPYGAGIEATRYRGGIPRILIAFGVVVLVVAAFLLARASGIDTLLLLKVAGGAGVAIGALLLAGRIISGMRAAPTVASKRREESLPGPDKIPSSEEARRIGPSYETASAANPSDTEMMITQATHPYSEHALPSTVLIREPSAMAWLLILNGPQRGRQFRLADTFTIGRGSHCDVVLDDSGVSRAHAEVFLKNNRFHVYDLGSANGLFVNGIQAVEQELRDRDEIRIGNTTLMFIQAVSPEDLTVEAKRRVREFDSVWDELTKSVRHE